MGEMSRLWDDLFRAHQAEEWKKEAQIREALYVAIRSAAIADAQDALSTVEQTLVEREDDHGAAVVSWCINEIGSVK